MRWLVPCVVIIGPQLTRHRIIDVAAAIGFLSIGGGAVAKTVADSNPAAVSAHSAKSASSREARPSSSGDTSRSGAGSGSSARTIYYGSAAETAEARDLDQLYAEMTYASLEEADTKAVLGNEGVPVPLILDVTVNGNVLPDVVMGEVTSKGDIMLPESFWVEARLKPSGTPTPLSDGENGYKLAAVAGLTYSLDRALLALTITAPAEAFEPASIDIGRSRRPSPRTSSAGGYMNYDFSVTQSSDGSLSYGGTLGAVMFNGRNSLVNRIVLRGNNRGTDLEAVRTETFWQRDLPSKMMTLVLGDTVSSEGGWSQPVRFGGIRVGRNFGLAPSFITFPLPSISGSAALPSTIDLLINNSRAQPTRKVRPGAFDITGVPVVTGAGQINLVVTDLRGTQSILTQDYYSSARLLSPGLSDFSFEAGALRRDFGSRSNSYGPAFIAASWRRGVTPGLTVQGRFELQRKRQAAGGEAVVKLGNVALARGGISFASGRLSSVREHESGWHYLAGLERIDRRGSLSVAWEYFDESFEQFGNYASFSRPRERLRVSAGISPFSGLSVGASYIDQKSWDAERYRIVSGNVGMSLPEGINLSAYVAHQRSGRQGMSFGINLTRSLGQQRSASASANRSRDGRYIKRVTVAQSAPVGPGLGWRIEASDDTDRELRAGLTLNTDMTQLSADMDIRSGFSAVRFGARGSVGWMKGLPFTSREIDDRSFAVVKVGDLPGVKIYRANQYAATTNRKGLALVTGLLPYEVNRISFEADELPFNVEIGGTEDHAVPYARAGVFIDFPVKRSLNALIRLHSPSGEPLPIGSIVHAGNGQEYLVGRRGEAYLTELSTSNRLDITWPGGACTLELSIAADASEEPEIGPIICGEPQ